MQTIINEQSKKLQDAAAVFKDVKKAWNNMLKEVRKDLMDNPKYRDSFNNAERLKTQIKIAKEALIEENKNIEQMEMETDEYQEMEETLQDAETKFANVKDAAIKTLSTAAAENNITAEVQITDKPEAKLIVCRG